ncbi:hypothetical protein [Blastococcus montanus]|uniref:hypothetical protein n=1 Tax=Blastococcus montanus TaxID=3144973 RepID=UPI00320AB69E
MTTPATTSALPFTALTPAADLLEVVAPYLTVGQLTRTELELRATLLDVQRCRCAACGGDLPRLREKTGRARTFLWKHPTETVPGRLRLRPLGLVCGRCKQLIVLGARHPEGLRMFEQLRAADPFGHLPRSAQRSLTRGPDDGALRSLTVQDAAARELADDTPGALFTRDGRIAIHQQLTRDIRGAAVVRGLDVRVWYVLQDAGFVLGPDLVTVEVKTLPAGRSPDPQLRKGAEQVLRYVHTQQADAAEEPWFHVAGITRIVPVLAVDRVRPVPAAWHDVFAEQGIVLIGAGELCAALQAGDDSWLPAGARFVPAPLAD